MENNTVHSNQNLPKDYCVPIIGACTKSSAGLQGAPEVAHILDAVLHYQGQVLGQT